MSGYVTDNTIEYRTNRVTKLPSLLDTFGSPFLLGGVTTALVCHGEIPSQVAPPFIMKTKKGLGV